MGGATYVLPIEVPPDRAPIPVLAWPTGIIRQWRGGRGMSLAGLSAITQQGDWDVDGFNGCIDYGPDDRYVLDGQR